MLAKLLFHFALGISITVLLTPVARSQDQRCLDKIYPAGAPRDASGFRFDASFEGDSGGGYSCWLQMRPSELRRALDEFRNGVLYQDASSIRAVVRFPIDARVSNSLEFNAKVATIRIRNAAEWIAFQNKYLTKTQTALVACSYLGNVTVESGGRTPGVMIGLGTFWFQSFVGSWSVKLTAVNLDPVSPETLAKSCVAPGIEAK
jgi:hypothetical protein